VLGATSRREADWLTVQRERIDTGFFGRSGSVCASRQPRSAPRFAVMGWTRRRGRRLRRGGRSCASRPPTSWPVTSSRSTPSGCDGCMYCSSSNTTLAGSTSLLSCFDDVFRAEGAEVLVTPVQAPNANAYAERWIRTVHAECLDWRLIVGRGHLEQALRIHVEHYNRQRPHRALGLEPPEPSAGLILVGEDRRVRVRRRDLPGGLLHEYRRAA